MTKSFFVYGTLKQDECRGLVFREVLEHNNFEIIPAITSGVLYDLGDFPAMAQGEGKVFGELIKLSDKDYEKVLPILDIIEGYNGGNSLYCRKEVEVETKTGHYVATTYLFENEELLKEYGIELDTGKWNSYQM